MPQPFLPGMQADAQERQQPVPPGFQYHPQALDLAEQRALLAAISTALLEAPLFRPRMPRTGRPFSVRMSNCGPTGWVSDKAGGYRYQPHHPLTSWRWPAMPAQLVALWRSYLPDRPLPDCCLINYYDRQAKMGLHQDRDEADLNHAVLSVSLGASAIFRLGGQTRRARARRLVLHSGDLLILDGAARLAYHGIDRILAGNNPLTTGTAPHSDWRINLTLRRSG